MNEQLKIITDNQKKIINSLSKLAFEKSDGKIKKARKWLKEQLFYTADKSIHELISLAIDNLEDYQETSSKDTTADVL